MGAVVIIPAPRRAEGLVAAVRQAQAFAGAVLSAEDMPKGIGYGAAVKNALVLAAHMGFSHAILLDLDRQHEAADLPKLIDAAARHPNAIVIAQPQFPPGLPSWTARLARGNSDFWTWAETGRRIRYSAYGYRAYPLAAIKDFALRSNGYEIDVELLVKAVWAGVDVVTIPATAPLPKDDPPSFVPVRDMTRFGALTTSLICQRMLLPASLRATMHRKEFADVPPAQRLRRIINDAVRHHSDHSVEFAACIGLGAFFGIAPIWGFQMLTAAVVAHLLRLNKALVVAATYVSSPITIPFILYGSLVIGHLIYFGRFEGLPRPQELHRSVLLQYLGQYLVGAVVLAVVAGMVSALLAYVAASAVKALRGKPSC